jgi:signal transduction histidine kinase/ActR/RegA family two-component response regulator
MRPTGPGNPTVPPEPASPASRLAFLAEAGNLLASSLDYQTTLATVALLAVPTLADWCAVDLVEADGRLERVTVMHTDPAKVELARELARRYPPDPNRPHGVPEVIRTGRAELHPEVSDDLLRERVPDEELRRILRQLGLRSAMIVPLLARGRALGALTLVAAESGRRYEADDLALAQDLANRCAVAVDNARLYGAAQAAEQRHRDQEEELRRRADALAAAARHKDEFLAVLAHELRNPLAPIHNALYVLRLRGADAATLTWAEDVLERQVGHLTRMIEDLLDVSRMARGKVVLKRERVDLTRLVRVAAEDHRAALERSRLYLELDLPPTPLWVEGDATRLSQVVDNLLHNAGKFTNPGGRVTVRVQRAEGQAAVTVRDTGVGIAPDLLPHIFNTLTQADSTLERSQGGLGLGLALVKGLVELHGGAVQAHSDGLGQGTEFRCTLPLEQGQPEQRAAPPAAGQQGRALRILMVEDNRDGAETLQTLLRLAGHEVALAVTGPEGVELARRFRPDVVLCDIGLPGMDGFAVGRALRQDPTTARSRLIVLSGYGQEEDRRKSREAGFDLHLTKPVDPLDLLRLLRAQPVGARGEKKSGVKK